MIDPLWFVAAGLVVILLLLLAQMGRTKTSFGDDVEARLALVVNDRLMDFQKSVQASMDGTRKEVEASKGQVEQNAKDMYKHLGQLNQTIESLKNQNVGAQELAKNLEIMLQAPKLRGSHGEQILEEMLGRLLPEGMWEKQVNIAGREAVDAVVRFKDIMFPIDAKFPRDDYERYSEAPDGSPEKKAAWKGFENAIKTQINSISTKYVRPEQGTADFALMFIPSEAVFYETIATKNGLGDPNPLAELARTKKVIPVSPNTLYAFLQVLLTAVDHVRLAENTKRLREGLSKIELSFDRFYDRFEDVGKGLAKAAQAYEVGDGHVQRFHDRVQSVLKMEQELED